MRAVTSVLSLSVLFPVASLSAQVQPSIETGARVRVTASECGVHKQVTTFEAMRGDTLVLAGGWSMTCPLASVTRLDVSRGQKSHTWLGVGIGFLIGGSVGMAIGESHACCGEGEFPHDLGVAMCSVLGGLVGTLFGRIIGGEIKTDRWEEVPLDQLRVSLAPQRDGRLGFGLSVRF